ncbi:hybrid sensor histidine kinase/response regulator [Desertifilum tharense IPPAS B-1220]|uniref:Circadian input-output histidine kinase CikA n=1 Tax=Desertifilum tharense IPPAS B-1220 TaxID=1781255 RepID=A0A1E5QDS0_9CYAN|nr:PAS domain-containing sensor histidine kinase [Desertifilum tharense]OEJ72808.1 hypothetical protein BH720_22815 [Desertifilum tharense IPPAS B-1220]
MPEASRTQLSDSQCHRQLSLIPRFASAFVFGIGVLVLVGWVGDIGLLKSIRPEFVSMKANSAIAFIGLSIALWYTHSRRGRSRSSGIAQGIAIAVLALATLTLLQYVLGIDLGIDRLLFSEPPGTIGTAYPGRMAPNAAVNFILLASALLFLNQHNRQSIRFSQYLALMVALISWQPLLGYAYQFRTLYGIAYHTHMALHTAIAFVVLAVGVLSIHPHVGIMAIMASRSLGGFIARRLLIAAVIIPSVAGYLIAIGFRAQLYRTSFALALLVIVNIVFFSVLIWLNARTLDRADRDRADALLALQELTAELELRVEKRTDELVKANQALKQQIAERRQAEEALYNRQQELKALLENTPDVIIRCDRDLRYVYVNPAVERSTGVPAAALLGKTSEELGASEELCQLWNATLRRVFDTASEQTIEFQSPSVTGTRTYLSRVVPEFDREGVVQTALIVSRDISDRKATEEALRQREFTLRQYFELPLIGIAITSPEKGWIDVNQKLCDILGYSRQELQEMSWLELTHPEDLALDITLFHQALLGQRDGYSLDKRYIRKDGQIIYTNLSTRCIRRADGTVDYFVTLIQDITERKQAEEERAQLIREQAARAEAETANRMKDEFLATLSHELRTPINCILGWAQLLRTRQLNDSTRDRALETIERNARLQTQLVEDLLDVSKIVQGKITLKCRNANIALVIRRAVDTVGTLAAAKNIQVEMELDPAVEFTWADPDRLQQVVWNLLSNAIKFTPAQGRVTVILQQFSQEIAIQIRDTGKGISPEFLPHVFDRFRQADNSITRSHGGLGLGLAIVRHLVELHGGTIAADSAGEGKGTTFTVKLPVVQNPHLRNSDRPEPNRSASSVHRRLANLPYLKNLQVLLVEDDRDTCELIEMVLKQAGIQVTPVHSVKAALSVLDRMRPDAIISDIGMREVNGYDFMRLLRSLPSDRSDIPAIALTAYASDRDREQALAAGFCQHLSKPIEPEKLVNAIANLVQQTALTVPYFKL